MTVTTPLHAEDRLSVRRPSDAPGYPGGTVPPSGRLLVLFPVARFLAVPADCAAAAGRRRGTMVD